MTQKKGTPDERFLCKLYEIALSKGNPLHPVSIMAVAKGIGYKELAVKNMVKLLAQANFIKKVSDTQVSLTQNGCDFVLKMQE
jgi:Mn-dependent DtxR family transcriptional regulator